MKPNSKIIDLVLCEFQYVIRENLNQYGDAEHGHPPQYGYILHTEWTEHENKIGQAISAWHISSDIVRTSTIKELSTPKIEGMFYNMLRGWFYFTEDLSAVFINWQTGPKFGRGFKHRIGQDTLGEYLLDRGKCTWVS